MGSQLVAIEESQLTEFRAIGTNELKAMLAASIDDTASNLLRLAAIMRVLEERGEDFSSLKFGLKTYLRQIAHGRLLPGVVVRFADYPSLMQRISKLPIDDQRALATGETVTVVDGSRIRHVDPLRLTCDQVRQVFGPDGIRDEAEQREVIMDRVARKPPAKKFNVKVDRKNRTISVGNSSVPLESVLAAMAEASGLRSGIDKDQIPFSEKAHTPLTKPEKDRLKAMAEASGLPETEIVRRAVLAWLL